jgi:serine-type D-Ala-D-Ala carboxypeptidase (penicillin-binding protein 5/6)
MMTSTFWSVRWVRWLAIGLVMTTAPASAATDPFPQVARAYLVSVDGTDVWAHAASDKVAPASLTKLMTALLVDEAARPDEVVTVSPKAGSETGSRMGLKGGERMRVMDLLAAAMIASANDACRALAEWRDGSETAFVQRMNRKAAALGLKDTHFVNACGHDAAGHYSTARDLAKLSDAAMARPSIAGFARQIEVTVDGARSYKLTNRNALIGRYDGAVGVKSGFTAKAGKCVIALAERGGVRVLLVMLGGRDRWWDAHAMLNHAFDYAASAR